MVILAHEDPDALADVVRNIRHFCPHADLLFYNSGPDPSLGEGLDLPVIPNSNQQTYENLTPYYLDVFEWLINSSISFDYFVHLESDMLFIDHGFENWLVSAMEGYDFMASHLSKFHKMKQHYPYKTIRPELPNWYKLFGFEYVHWGFNPGYVFSRKYVESIVNFKDLPTLREMVENSKAFALQEILLPTFTDVLGLEGRPYPRRGNRRSNRFRPYIKVWAIRAALKNPQIFFVHPVSRKVNNKARVYIRNLIPT